MFEGRDATRQLTSKGKKSPHSFCVPSCGTHFGKIRAALANDIGRRAGPSASNTRHPETTGGELS